MGDVAKIGGRKYIVLVNVSKGEVGAANELLGTIIVNLISQDNISKDRNINRRASSFFCQCFLYNR